MHFVHFKFLIAVLLLHCFIYPTVGQNYNESNVPAYSLPDPLRNNSGKQIKSIRSWKKRRKEILFLFKEHVYGHSPDKYDEIQFGKTTDTPAMNGRAVLRKTFVKIFKGGKFLTQRITMFLPALVKKPLPIFLLINHRDTNTTDPTRKLISDFWPAETLIDSGYAIAAFHVSDVSPDDRNNYTKGVFQLYPALLTAENGMKAIGAWAWGASRVVDYLITDSDIDASKIILIGHSRGGKAALWAGAQDPRFNMIISNCSGNTGAALARRKFGETIAKINTGFPYWFASTYKNFNDKEELLPVDQHMLLSLIAPRPVYVGNAEKDLWADPYGSYLSLKHAAPVYKLYKIPVEPIMTLPVKPLINSQLGYHLREGGHDLTLSDWVNYIRFANYHFR